MSLKILRNARTQTHTAPFKEIYVLSENTGFFTAYIKTDDVFIMTVFCGTSDRSEIIAWWIYPVGNSGKKEGGKKSDPPGISV